MMTDPCGSMNTRLRSLSIKSISVRIYGLRMKPSPYSLTSAFLICSMPEAGSALGQCPVPSKREEFLCVPEGASPMGNYHIGFAALMFHKGLHQSPLRAGTYCSSWALPKNIRLALLFRKERAMASWRCPSAASRCG